MKKRNVINTLALVCLFCFTIINFAWACDPTNPDCNNFNHVSGTTSTDFTHTFGDTANGGWSTITGSMCGTSQGDKSATFNGHLKGTTKGAFNSNGETANSKAKLIFNGHGTNKKTGFSNISANGVANESSSKANNSQTDWYANTSQTAKSSFSAEDSTTGRKLNFAADSSSKGSSGYSFKSAETSRSLNIMANNAANASFTGDGTAETTATNEIAGGAMLKNTVAEIYGTANTCPESDVAWTKGNGNINIKHIPITNGFRIRADVGTSENSNQ